MKKILLALLVSLTLGGFTIEAIPVQASTNITVRMNNKKFKARLYDNRAANKFKKRLPETLKFRNYGTGFEEKIADSAKLSTKGMTSGDDPKPGQIAYWSPEPRIVLYFGNVDYYDGIHLIGEFNNRKAAAKYLRTHKKLTVKINLAK